MTENDSPAARGGAPGSRRQPTGPRPRPPRVKVTKLDERVPDQLYLHYDLEPAPQLCHVAFDVRTGELSAHVNRAYGGSQPATVGRRVVRWWTIPCLTAADANALMRELVPFAQRVLKDTKVQRNVGVLGPDAEAAERQIQQLIADRIVDAAVWFKKRTRLAGFSSTTTDEELDSIIANQRVEIALSRPDRYTLLGNARAYLIARREQLRQAERDELQAAAADLKTSKETRDRLIATMSTYADNREIADMAGLTPEGVDVVLATAPKPAPSSNSRHADHAALRAAASAMGKAKDRRDELIVRIRTYNSAYAIAPWADMTRQGVAYVVAHAPKPKDPAGTDAPTKRTRTTTRTPKS